MHSRGEDLSHWVTSSALNGEKHRYQPWGIWYDTSPQDFELERRTGPERDGASVWYKLDESFIYKMGILSW